MILIIIIAILVILKFMEVGFVANLSWWWVVGLMVFAFIWFEYIEKMLGLDKRKAHDEMDKIRQKRVEENFKKKK